MRPTLALRAAGAALLVGAAIHLIAYLAGPRWIALLGAPPSIVRSAERGTAEALVGLAAIIALLVILAVYCFGATRPVRRLPLQRVILGAAAILFLLRGLLVLPVLLAGSRGWATPVGRIVVNGPIPVFIAGSLVVLAIGLLIARGLAGSVGRR